MDEMAPLCVDAPHAMTYLFEEWIVEKQQLAPDLVDAYRIVLAPDYLHKAIHQWWAPYAILVPFLGACRRFHYRDRP